MISFKLRSHPTRRKTEVVEVYDDAELIAVIYPGAEGDPVLTRSIAIFSKHLPRGHEIVVFAKQILAPSLEGPK